MAGFTAELAQRVQERFGKRDDVQEIFDFTKEVALLSFKNGLAASKTKHAPRWRGADPLVKQVLVSD